RSLDASRLLPDQVGGFQHRVTLGRLNSGRVGYDSDSIRSGIGLVANLRKHRGRTRSQIDSFIRALPADCDAFDRFGHVFAYSLDHIFDLASRSEIGRAS